MEKTEKDKCIGLLLRTGFHQNGFGGWSYRGREIVFHSDPYGNMASYPSPNSSAHVIVQGYNGLLSHLKSVYSYKGD